MAAKKRSWVGLVLVAGLLTACHGSDHANAKPVLQVSPVSAPFDTAVSISVRGLPAHHPVTLTLSGIDGKGVRWTSHASFQADAQGVVTTAQAPSDGSYTGTDPMGLFEVMAPPSSAPVSDDAFKFASTTTTLTLSVTENGKQVASQGITRTIPTPTVRRFTLATNGFIGTSYQASDAVGTKRPAVLVFGGSEGGESQDLLAALLASHGYSALSLAYFKKPGLPPTLADIDLRYFVKALQTLAKQPGVDPNKLVVYGVSRGSEAAQLLGSLFPNLVHGVIAGVPSSVVNGPYPRQSKPSWLLDGQALPEVPTYLYGDPNPAAAQDAVIKDELVHGPILLACAGQDAIWPSCEYQIAIVQRLKAHNFAYPITALSYPDAGHGIGSALQYDSETLNAYSGLGGDLLPTQQGRADVYQHVLALLSSLK